MPFILQLADTPPLPTLNPPTLPPPHARAVCGLRLHELPDVIAGARSTGRGEADELGAALARWADMLTQLRRWQNSAFALRYRCLPEQGRVEPALLLRVTSRAGTAERVAQTVAQQLEALLAQQGIASEPIAEHEALLSFLAPVPRGQIVELRQCEALLPVRALNQSFYAVEPHPAPGGPWLRPLYEALNQRAPTLISLHLEPTALRPAEREQFARKAALGQQLGSGVLAGTMIGSGRVQPEPAVGRAGQIFADNITRLREPFLLAAQIVSVNAASAAAVAREVAAAIAPGAALDRRETPFDVASGAFTRSGAWRTLGELALSDWGATDAPADQERLRYLVDAHTAAAAFRLPITPGDVSRPIPGINARMLRERQAASAAATARARQDDELALTLRFAPRDGYAEVTWEAHEVGHVVTRLDAPYDAATLPLVLAALDVVQSPHYPEDSPAIADVQRQQLAAHGFWENGRVPADVDRRLGQALYRALVADRNADRALATARNHAIAQGRPLSYLLRFAPGAEAFAGLPWELLHDPSGAPLMSSGRHALCVRYLDLDVALPPPVALGHTLRILAISPESDVDAGDRAADREARRVAWAPLVREGLAEVEELLPARIGELFDRVSEGEPVDVIHFYGHGRYADGRGTLQFDTRDGRAALIGAERFAEALRSASRPPRLVVLHACHSALGTIGLRAGVGPALTAAGIPAVVAMQLSMRTTAAARFTEKLYRALARGESLQAAVSVGRQALYSEAEDGSSWYVPTLTIRSRDAGPLRLVYPV